MITVVMYHHNERGMDTKIKTYETEFAPVVGDTYAGVEFEDGNMRKVISRLIPLHTTNTIIISVDFMFPELAEKKEKDKEEEAARQSTEIEIPEGVS